jgi:hypothetical protein
MIKKLTYKELQNAPPNSMLRAGNYILATSPYNEYEHEFQIIRWVAVRGQIDDYAIYYGSLKDTDAWIVKHGTKVHNTAFIREIVPCSDEAFKRYRH